MANFSATASLNGLQVTTLFAAPTAGLFFVDGKFQLPTISSGATANSAVVATVKNGVSTVYTGSAGAVGVYTTVACAAGDVVTITLTSAAAPDQLLNAVTGTVACGNAI